MGSSRTTNQTTNQTQTNAPPTWTAPGLADAGNMVTQAMRTNAGNPAYAGDFVAALDPTAVARQVDAYNSAADTTGQMAAFSQQQLESLFQPRDSQALLNNAINASINPVFERLREQVLPGITNSALMSGAYTNDRALGVVPEQAIRDASGEAADIAARLGYQGFQAEEDRRLQRGQLLPSLTNLVAQLATARGDVIGAGANVDQTARQQILDNAIQRHNYATTAPYENIAPAAQLLAALSGNWGTQNMTGNSTTVEKTGGLGSILQGVLGAASMAGSLGAFGPIGATAGGAGGAGGLFGNISKLFSSAAPAASSIFRN